ncbi:MFS transporter [Paraburkholderia sp. Ac-20336]|uniref:MFS transporter n=1 Tax=Burkholderiaceae TaxID=119060 RepID=UPI0014217F6D|nr:MULTISPECIES: MFS transporter [Burkholderiaceae]MBN3803470.1 MFS transporter [Paraburkholderia sp. Ac-20336]MBN3849171.1 MFS transporter [Paraburkholderia sp. Ac-20342]NIF55867.1 MFS transporter [Burkholderia sp. Ax-1724]NIF79445.1 MFS transporter [Paraburkholderia sp. Cy-641]
MNETTTLNVGTLLGNQPLRWLHILIVALLAATMVVDGYDIFMVGLILPALSHGLNVHPAALTQVFVLQQLALLIGTLVSGPMLDRFGRRRVLLVAMPVFAVLTIATSQVRSVLELDVMRFAAALFFSAVIPAAITLANEFAPAKYRSAAVSVVFCGYAGGNLIGASVQAWILPFGWQAAFWVGGLLPLVLAGCLWLWLPESLQFLAMRDPANPAIGNTLRRLDPAFVAAPGQRYAVHDKHQRVYKLSPKVLFTNGRAAVTLLLWGAYLATGIFSYINNSWTTTLLHLTRHMPMAHIAGLLAVSAIAGVIGTASSGFVMDRFGAARVLPSYLTASALIVAVIATMDVYSQWAPFAFAALGFLYNSSWGALNAFCATISPAEMRATSVAWAHGASKVAGMIGPAIGGAMVRAQWDFTPIFLVAAAFELLSACAVLLLVTRRKAAPVPLRA